MNFPIEEIETIVTVQYRTPDGELFNDIASALEHTPKQKKGYKMWVADRVAGLVETIILEDAQYLYLPTKTALNEFIMDSDDADLTTEGIDDEIGWYEWNPTLFEWCMATDSMITILESILVP